MSAQSVQGGTGSGREGPQDAAGGTPSDRPGAGGRPPGGRDAWSPRRIAITLVAAGLVVVLVRLLLVQTFVIPSGSMEPGLQVGDRVVVSRVDYRFGAVRRGDVVVFDGDGVFAPAREPGTALAELGRTVAGALGGPVGENDFVKRVIGVGGDRVACCDPDGRVTVDGHPLQEPYVYPGDAPSDVRFDVVVPPGHLWMMGDHRGDSADSREHLGDPGGGMVPVDRVVGRVVAVWWPLDRATGVGRVDPTAGATAAPSHAAAHGPTRQTAQRAVRTGPEASP